MNINYENTLAEFTCQVCHERWNSMFPGAPACAWRCIDRQYCPELQKVYADIHAEEYRKVSEIAKKIISEVKAYLQKYDDLPLQDLLLNLHDLEKKFESEGTQ